MSSIVQICTWTVGSVDDRAPGALVPGAGGCRLSSHPRYDDVLAARALRALLEFALKFFLKNRIEEFV